MIRTLQISEGDLAAGFVGRLIAELSPGYRPDEAALRTVAEVILAKGQNGGFVAEEAGVPVGLILFNECAAIYAGGRFGEVTELYVMPEHRSCGVARQLLSAVRDEGRARGWTRIEVGAPNQPDWARTLAFYQREGFTEVGPRLKFTL